MIPRYSRPEMTAIWEPECKFSIWLDIELHACDAMAELGTIPKKAAEDLRKSAAFNITRIDDIEAEVKHDVI
ncbi:MAG TPA: adenylosuccinate lyase, partial [Alphaproteobacteria bacterium]|nr:adenylosuccinate lyase [Alphaproteobacteria bacterium]